MNHTADFLSSSLQAKTIQNSLMASMYSETPNIHPPKMTTFG